MKHGDAAGLLFVISAPSGAGKTSLVNALRQRDEQLGASISHTTRPMRPGERDGLNYHFVSTETFENMIDQRAFLEHAKVFDFHYGTAKTAVDTVWRQGRDVILEIDWQGAEQIRRAYPECCSIFILPPSRDALAERLASRGQDSATVIAKRTVKAKEEMAHCGDFDYRVVNDDFQQALAELNEIIAATRRGATYHQAELGPLLERLLG